MKRFLSDYGSALAVLLILAIVSSIVTIDEHNPITPAAGRKLAARIIDATSDQARVVILVRETPQDAAFAEAVATALSDRGATVVSVDKCPTPADARRALLAAAQAGETIDAVATHAPGAAWGPLQADRISALSQDHPALAETQVFSPQSYVWPRFLTRENLLNIVNQNADVAIIAIGMTLVIFTGGIDLSVGSLLAVAGVVTAISVQSLTGGKDAGAISLFLCAMLGVAACGACGLFSGSVATLCRIPAFVVTLAMMMMARGLALIMAVSYQKSVTGGTSATPEAVRIEASGFGWLGNGNLLGIPNPIWLMLLLYVCAHIVMTRTSWGRYVYAVGGNAEAARLSGVPVRLVLILVYVVCGIAAGLAGTIDASRFEGGRPSGGEFYELRVIAAVVVGGTSLSGGEGRVFGTLIGALIIAEIENGLNMWGVSPYLRMVIFGGLILVAALLDQLKRYQRRGIK